MTSNNDRRLIEDYLPIESVGREAQRENARKGHISTLHIWRARRPLVACRAAVYGTVIPAPIAKAGRGPKSDFVSRLCKYPGDATVINKAKQQVLEAHKARLSIASDKTLPTDLESTRVPRPKILDMFAGGGAIPLEALRLGCDAYALELNPVAHLIELCTLEYPQKFGEPDNRTKGSAPDGTWAGLSEEVDYWGKWIIDKVKSEVGGLYPVIPDPENPPHRTASSVQEEFDSAGFEKQQPHISTSGGYVTPVAYLWTRTVRCKNPRCGATVPLFRQTWLRKKPSGYVALKPHVNSDKNGIFYELVKASKESSLGFDPAEGSSGTTTVCRCCSTTIDAAYVREFGNTKGYGQDLMAVVCTSRMLKKGCYLFVDARDFDKLPLSEARYQG